MSDKAEIEFRVLAFPESEPVIGLVFMKDGRPVFMASARAAAPGD